MNYPVISFSFIFNILDLRLLSERSFLLAVQSLHTSILAPPDNFKSREDYLSGSSIKGDYLVYKIGLSCHVLCVLYFLSIKKLPCEETLHQGYELLVVA